MDPDPPAAVAPASPPIWRWVVSFLAVGACWGLTTPFMRRAAVVRDQQPKPQRPYLTSDAPWWKRKFWSILYAVIDLLKNPAYAVPLLLNVTGSVWFFLLIGQAELSLTVPITNSLAFLFTVLGEWWAEGKVISRDTWIGMTFVLGGIALCVHSKTHDGPSHEVNHNGCLQKASMSPDTSTAHHSEHEQYDSVDLLFLFLRFMQW